VGLQITPTPLLVWADATSDKKTLTVYGDPVYYGTSKAVSSVSSDGVLTNGQSLTVTTPKWFVTSPDVGLAHPGSARMEIEEHDEEAEHFTAIEDRLAILEAGGLLDGGVTATADTFEDYKIILLAQNNAVKAIPLSATAPATPTGLTVTPRLSSTRVVWNTAARASQYRVFRDGSLVKTTTALSWRDLTATTLSHTYSYVVQAVDVYGQRSQPSAAVTGFIDPALNVAPTVTVKAWPPTYPSNGRTYLRVNAADANGQTLTLALGVSAGSIVATDDPSIWIYTP
jgi:hypothetical protein